MQHTVAAVFTNFAEAQAAREELLRSGFAEDDVTLNGDDGAAPVSEAEETQAREKEGGITGFFHRLFGHEDEIGDAALYSEAMRRGNIVLTVEVPEDGLVDRAAEVIDRYHPVNIEDHASQWQEEARRSQQSPSSDAAGGTALEAGPDDPLVQAQRDVLDDEAQSLSPVADEETYNNADIAQLAGETAVGSARPRSGGARVYTRPAGTVESIGQSGGARYFDDDFRSHWDENYAPFGGHYEDYSPAYLYGAGLNDGGRFAGHAWADIEDHARTGWEEQYPQPQYPASAWERVKGAVRHGWEKATR